MIVFCSPLTRRAERNTLGHDNDTARMGVVEPMDPLERADVALARARARGTFVVTPESAVSPMDAASTLQIPGAVVPPHAGRRDPDSTMQVPLPDQSEHRNVPAIAQEAYTDVVAAPPGIRSRQRRIEHARTRGAAQQQTTELEIEQPAPPA